jgi:hypothetical protein
MIGNTHIRGEMMFVFFVLYSQLAFAHEAAFEFEDSVYVFHAGAHVRYQKGSSKAVEGYPLPIDDQVWPGLEVYRTRIVAALNQNATHIVFFLSDGRFLIYDAEEKKVQQAPLDFSDEHWKGLAPFFAQISAAYRWNERHSYFFLSDSSVLRYDHEQQKVDEGYPKPVADTMWKGIDSSFGHVVQIFSWNTDSMFLFFSSGTYVRYNRSTNRVDDGYPKKISEKRWPGMGDWLCTDARISLSDWNHEHLTSNQSIAFQLPYQLTKQQRKKHPSVRNDRFLTAKNYLVSSSEYPDVRSAFRVEVVQAQEEDVYERVILQNSEDEYLVVDGKGRVRTTSEKEKAEVFFIDGSWGAHVVLFHHRKSPRWKNRDKLPEPNFLLPLYFVAQGEETVALVGEEVCGGSLLRMFVAE